MLSTPVRHLEGEGLPRTPTSSIEVVTLVRW